MGHQYSDNCDCASCDAFRGLRNMLDGTEQDNLVPEEVELDEIPCSRCGQLHIDTYKWVLPMCLDCEKDMVPVR